MLDSLAGYFLNDQNLHFDSGYGGTIQVFDLYVLINPKYSGRPH